MLLACQLNIKGADILMKAATLMNLCYVKSKRTVKPSKYKIKEEKNGNTSYEP